MSRGLSHAHVDPGGGSGWLGQVGASWAGWRTQLNPDVGDVQLGLTMVWHSLSLDHISDLAVTLAIEIRNE